MEKLLRSKKFLGKKGLSTIVITLILVAISLAAVALVWTFVGGLVRTQISQSQACFGNYDKVKINPAYTCYERVGSSDNYNFLFSLSIGDVTLDKVLVAVSSQGTTKSYQITYVNQTLTGLSMYPSGSSQIILPGANSGLTYNATGFSSTIDSIQIAPVIGGNVCQVSDSISEIEACTF
ncbi:Uncharacterised protein [uncultured archaeon]|nr:Uncharacterised protein [uncultured archaeon]